MALPATIYKATISLSDLDRGVYETLTATVAQHPSETEERLVARLLAYALFYEEGLSFTKGLCAGDEPELWLKNGDGRVRLWVEVGLPDNERITRASRHSEQVRLLACGRAMPSWEQQHLPKLARCANLSIITIDQPFVAAIVQRLERSLTWGLTITEGVCYLTIGNETLETALQVVG